ncbi:MAG: hypothetical protein OHK93_003911 [Ramalina farinacea]|uniref:histone acetyltransferase n=1 Tax=Ramalina farinacea TaxID=258253 RepID=A0AA43QHG1_9LECA|nr:hypothetical protein [Ramalina farinacea]
MTLAEVLAEALPKGYKFILHHVSTPPTKCPALFAAPPGQSLEETYCESQFMSISIDHNGSMLQIFAIEVPIYTTRHLTTLFVSKADSTGYLHLLNLPKGTPSPLRTIATTFLQYLIRERNRKNRRLVLSLFARAQNQYLFPGSVENAQKHVLDDYGLIKWWCRVVDPMLQTHIGDEEEHNAASPQRAAGYLRVPGYDAYSTKTFFPRRPKVTDDWAVADPLRDLASSPDLPERCLIPRFPDDPKARFVETLDEEIPDPEADESQVLSQEAVKAAHTGKWRSIGSLDQFWDAMSFRQECSSGRLVGFLWAVFTPQGFAAGTEDGDTFSKNVEGQTNGHTKPNRAGLQDVKSDSSVPILASSSNAEPPRTPPQCSSAYLEPSSPTPVKVKEMHAFEDQPEKTESYYWPVSSRGNLLLRQKDYDRLGRMLLRLDYADEEVAADSSRRWINGAADLAKSGTWGREIIGRKEIAVIKPSILDPVPGVSTLGSGLIRKKKRPAADDIRDLEDTTGVHSPSAGLVRKKSKIDGANGNSEVPAGSAKG